MNTFFAVAVTVNTLEAASGMIIATLAIAGVMGLFIANLKNSKQDQSNKNASEALAAAQSLIAIQKDQLAAQRQDMLDRDKQHMVEITELRNKYIESGKAIANLQGQIDIIKNIPLRDIDSSLKNISAILEKSAVDLATNTEKLAVATNKVKEDLAASHV